jgi:Asp-tRNA(Asn)/Glu-tRNA(Gln) amidotransferase C subunit
VTGVIENVAGGGGLAGTLTKAGTGTLQLDVANIEPTAHPSPVFGRMRNDEPHESLPPSAVLQNAPDQAQSQIRVPKVVTDA